MQSRSALELYRELQAVKPCPLACPILNKVMGGVPSSGITEIAGEAGSGKTQFCLSTSLTCALNGIRSSSGWNVAYICCGEGNFPLKRFLQLAENIVSDPLEREEVLRSVHIETCHTIDDAFHTVDALIPSMCQRGVRIRLVIIDSIAGLVRTEFDTRTAKEMAARTNMLFKFSSKLKWLSDTYKLGIIAVNQVTAAGFEDGAKNLIATSCHSSSGRGMWPPVAPALGLVWSHCVNSRILLERSATSFQTQIPFSSSSSSVHGSLSVDSFGAADFSMLNKAGTNDVPSSGANDKENIQLQSHTASRSKRRLSVVYAPHLASQSCEFEITSSGEFHCFCSQMDQIPLFFFVAIYATHIALLRFSSVSATSTPSVSSKATRASRPLIVGLNPALQRTITVPNLKVGSVNRGSKVLVGIGGKGQNAVVAANCMESNMKPTLLQYLGNGFEGDALMSLLHSKTDSLISIRTKATCRVCVTLLNGDESTEIIEPSDSVLPSEIDALLTTLQAEYSSHKAPSIAIMGSMPKGCPPNLYASIISKCANKDTKIVLDTVAGLADSLQTAVSLGSCVLLKVNANELLSLANKAAIASGAVSPVAVREAGFEFIQSWVSASSSSAGSVTSSGDASSSHVYIAVTDGPHPSHLLKVPLSVSASDSLSVSARQWVLTSQPLPGPVESPIGAGDATSSGTLMHLSKAIDLSRLGAIVPSSDTTSSKTTTSRENEFDESVVNSFRWGIACGGASCLSTANSVFSMTDATAIFAGIKVIELKI